MKLTRPIVIGRLLLIVVLLASVASACVYPRHQGEMVVQEYIEAAFLQDRDRALECLTSSYAAQHKKEDEWFFSIVIRGILKDVDQFQLHFDPWEQASVTLKSGEVITVVVISCQVLHNGEDACWPLRFYLVQEQGEWKIWEYEQDPEYVRPD